MKLFTKVYKDYVDNFSKICKYAEKSDESIRNGINDISTLKNNNSYVFKCTNKSYLEWLANMESLNKKRMG